MKPTLLFNLLNSEAHPGPGWTAKINYFQSHGIKVTILASQNVIDLISRQHQIKNVKFLLFAPTSKSDARFQVKSKIHFLILSFWRNLIGIRYLSQITSRYDIIYSPTSVLDMILLPWMAKLLNPRLKWVTLVDNFVPRHDPGPRLTRFLAWSFFNFSLRLIRIADHIFVVTPRLKDQLTQLGFSSSRISLSGNALETELIRSVPSQPKTIDALFVGRINETKGIYDMLKVLTIITKKHPRFTLHILGEGDSGTKQQFSKQISRLNLTSNVKFLGYITGVDKFKIIKSAKSFWFLSVSDSESFGVALLEAAACGVPCFAYQLAPFLSIYLNGEVQLSPVSDYRHVAQNILNLIKAGDFSNPSGQKLLKHYTWDKIAAAEHAVITSLVHS